MPIGASCYATCFPPSAAITNPTAPCSTSVTSVNRIVSRRNRAMGEPWSWFSSSTTTPSGKCWSTWIRRPSGASLPAWAARLASGWAAASSRCCTSSFVFCAPSGVDWARLRWPKKRHTPIFWPNAWFVSHWRRLLWARLLRKFFFNLPCLLIDYLCFMLKRVLLLEFQLLIAIFMRQLSTYLLCCWF